MNDLYWLTDEQIARLPPCFPKSHGKPRIDDRRVLSGLDFVNSNGPRWCNAPRAYGPHKTLYDRWKRWGERGVFLRTMEGLASAESEPKTVMIDATYLKAHRTASSLRVEKGISAAGALLLTAVSAPAASQQKFVTERSSCGRIVVRI
jgi:transposase